MAERAEGKKESSSEDELKVREGQQPVHVKPVKRLTESEAAKLLGEKACRRAHSRTVTHTHSHKHG